MSWKVPLQDRMSPMRHLTIMWRSPAAFPPGRFPGVGDPRRCACVISGRPRAAIIPRNPAGRVTVVSVPVSAMRPRSA